MKRRIILFVLLIIISGVVILSIYNKDNNYIEQDGVKLALSLDGESIDSFPSSGKYYVSVECSNAHGQYMYNEKSQTWKLTLDSITDNAICSVDFVSNPKTLRSTIEDASKFVTISTTEVRTGVVNEGLAGFRYEGKEPNNWVWFNNEYWRIIGSIPTKVDDSGTIENVVKIIRNDSLGVHSWNKDTSTVAWGANTLFTLLNEKYYGKQNANNDNPLCLSYSTTSFAQCDYRANGIDPNGYYGKMVKDVYWNVYWASYASSASGAYNEEIKDRTLKAKIGLMNLSDFGYAASTRGTTAISSYTTELIVKSNWLYSSAYEWTMTRHANNYQISITDRYGPSTYVNSNDGKNTRPALYLDPTVYVVSGDGSITNPYKLAM